MVAPQTGDMKKAAEAGVEPLNTVTLVLADTVEVDPEPKVWNKGGIVAGTIGFMCCHILGLPAMILAIFSYVDHSNKNYAGSLSKQRKARRLGIAAIIVGILWIALTTWAYYKYCPVARRHHHHHHREDYETEEFDGVRKGQVPEAMERMMKMKGERSPGNKVETVTEIELTMDGSVPMKKVMEHVRNMMKKMHAQNIPLEKIRDHFMKAVEKARQHPNPALDVNQIEERMHQMIEEARKRMMERKPDTQKRG